MKSLVNDHSEDSEDYVLNLNTVDYADYLNDVFSFLIYSDHLTEENITQAWIQVSKSSVFSPSTQVSIALEKDLIEALIMNSLVMTLTEDLLDSLQKQWVLEKNIFF